MSTGDTGSRSKGNCPSTTAPPSDTATRHSTPQTMKGNPQMPTLAKGANIPVDGQSVKAVLSWETNFANDSIDISALLLTESGRVRDDDDFIIYNQPPNIVWCRSPPGQGDQRPGGGNPRRPIRQDRRR